MQSNLSRITREWLAEVVEKSGVKPTPLATAIGVSPSTLTRPLKNEDWSGSLSTSIIARIVNYTGIPAPKELVPQPVQEPGFREDELKPWNGPTDHPIRKMGDNVTDVWRVETDAVNLEGIVPGDLVLVNGHETPRSGDVVVAQIYDDDTGNAETVLRVYEPPFLMQHSTGAAQAKPLLVDGERVAIRGVVTTSLGGRRPIPHRR
jgi:hypothetical protein